MKTYSSVNQVCTQAFWSRFESRHALIGNMFGDDTL